MHILGWIVFGLIVGAIARLLMPGRQPLGIILTILLGIAGSFVGGWVFTLLRGNSLSTAEPSSWIGAIIGAFLILFLYGLFANRSPNAP
jgi:uncharacterized membrane protein YeaQ/YmgE (transglycosylase-associated protein family)